MSGIRVGVASIFKVLVTVKYWVRVDVLVTPSSITMGSSCVLNKNISLKIFRGVFYSYREITSSERNVDCLGLGLKSMISNGGWEVTTLTRVTDSRGTRSRVWVLVTVTYLVLSLSESATWNRQSIMSNQKKENVLIPYLRLENMSCIKSCHCGSTQSTK